MVFRQVDRGDPTSLHEQVTTEIRRAITEGEAKPGERLPPARDLAAVLGVNPNTVLKALRELRDEGLVTFGRGRGVTVAGGRRGGRRSWPRLGSWCASLGATATGQRSWPG